MILVIILFVFIVLAILFYPTARVLQATYENGIMTIVYSSGTVKKYKGSVTVWHELPYMQRPGTFKEHELSELYQYIKEYGNPYPTDHTKH